MKATTRFSTDRFLNLTVAVWGACITMFQVVLLSIEENQFLSGGAFLLLIGVAAGVGLLLAPWLQRRSGYLVLVLAVLWWAAVLWFRRDDSALFVWGLVWGAIAYALPAVLLLLFSGTDRSPRLIWLVAVLAVVLAVFMLAVALGTSSTSSSTLFPISTRSIGEMAMVLTAHMTNPYF